MLKDAKEIAAQLRMPHGEDSGVIVDFMARANGPMYHLALSLMKFSPGNNVLEIGPANGAFVDYFLSKENQINYYGVDLSPDMVTAASQLHHGKVNVEFKFGSVENLPYPNDFFDFIVTVNTLYFWPDPLQGLMEILRVLKKNGSFSIAIRERESMSVLEFSKYGFTLYSESDAEKLMRQLSLSSFTIHRMKEKVRLPDGVEAELENLCLFGVKA